MIIGLTVSPERGGLERKGLVDKVFGQKRELARLRIESIEVGFARVDILIDEASVFQRKQRALHRDELSARVAVGVLMQRDDREARFVARRKRHRGHQQQGIVVGVVDLSVGVAVEADQAVAQVFVRAGRRSGDIDRELRPIEAAEFRDEFTARRLMRNFRHVVDDAAG